MSEAERRNLAEIDSDDDQIEPEVSVSTQGLAPHPSRFPNVHWQNACQPMWTSHQF